jgi:hypothetical protein
MEAGARAWVFIQTASLRQWDNSDVGCLFVVLVLAFPRLVLVLMFLFSNYLQRAYHDLLLPIVGFIFVPLTTIVYAWLVNSHMPLEGINLLILVVAVLIDLGGLGGGEWHRRRRYYD